ncbi:MAG: hypothetical protein EOM20_13415 [Spartobacteria bacterium]|nr:hypothetical protein [Spartobacteria bacterium]
MELPTTPAISSSKRFVVKGLTTPEHVELAVWLEDVAESLEELLDRSLAFDRGEPLTLVMRVNPDGDEGQVYAMQRWSGFRLQQEILVVNPGRVNQEDVLEALVGLLLNRFPIAGQSLSSRGERLAEVPEWLAVGVAANLYGVQRARNDQVALAAWAQGVLPGLGDIITGMPYEGPERTAWLGLATAWLLGVPPAPAILDGIFAAARRGEAWEVESLIPLFQVDTFGEIEQQWDLWVIARQQVRSEWGAVSAADLEALEESLLVRPEIISMITREDGTHTLTIADLIEQRDVAWMLVLARFMEMRVQSLGIGRSRGFQAVLNEYALFFRQLGARRKGLFAQPGAEKSAGELYDQLERAHAARRALEATLP